MKPISSIQLTRLEGCHNCFLLGSLRIIATDSDGWDHVSVSLADRCPTWGEMCLVKDHFFHPEEAVVQYHPPHSEYVNVHPFCLHLWRPQYVELVRPPKWMVA